VPPSFQTERVARRDAVTEKSSAPHVRDDVLPDVPAHARLDGVHRKDRIGDKHVLKVPLASDEDLALLSVERYVLQRVAWRARRRGDVDVNTLGARNVSAQREDEEVDIGANRARFLLAGSTPGSRGVTSTRVPLETRRS
jgi:hypothetical protein